MAQLYININSFISKDSVIKPPSLTNRDHQRSVSVKLEVRSGQLHHHSAHRDLSLLTSTGLTWG